MTFPLLSLPSQMEVDSEVQEVTTAQMEKKFKQNKINLIRRSREARGCEMKSTCKKGFQWSTSHGSLLKDWSRFLSIWWEWDAGDDRQFPTPSSWRWKKCAEASRTRTRWRILSFSTIEALRYSLSRPLPKWERSMRGYFRISHSGTEWFDMSLATRIAALSSLKSQRWKLFQNNFEVKTHDPHWCWRRKFGSDRVFETLRELVLKYFVLMTGICLWLEVPVWQDCHVSHLLLFRVESLAWWSPSSPAEVTTFSVLSVVLLSHLFVFFTGVSLLCVDHLRQLSEFVIDNSLTTDWGLLIWIPWTRTFGDVLCCPTSTQKIEEILDHFYVKRREETMGGPHIFIELTPVRSRGYLREVSSSFNVKVGTGNFWKFFGIIIEVRNKKEIWSVNCVP